MRSHPHQARVPDRLNAGTAPGPSFDCSTAGVPSILKDSIARKYRDDRQSFQASTSCPSIFVAAAALAFSRVVPLTSSPEAMPTFGRPSVALEVALVYDAALAVRGRRTTIPLLASLLWTAMAIVGLTAQAGPTACNGPMECCPAHLADALPVRQTVSVGVVVAGLYEINERAGTWDADYYLYETWQPFPNFSPQTEVVNETTRDSEQFDQVEIRRGKCVRSRRIYSTLHNGYNLRRFPFDRQVLTLELSDAEYPSSSVSYLERPYAQGLTESTRESLSSWKVESEQLRYLQQARSFKWEDGAPDYDYAAFSMVVRRHVTYHMLKFFLPLLVVVSLAFLVFWIDPDDLASQVQVGVTCVLAAIAFQFVQASALPEVAYTTLNDRIYVVCYLAIALALAGSVHTNSLARQQRRDRALLVSRRFRSLFPAATLIALAGAVVWSFYLAT
jgi:hypothetical protein